MTAVPTPATVEVVVLCGGRGTRLGVLTASTPKPLLPVAGVPFLLHRLLALRQEGVACVFLAVHYLAEQFHAFAERYARELPGLSVIEERTPLGTGGALRHAARHVRSPVFIVLNGDSWCPQALAPVVAEHGRRGSRFTMVVVEAARVQGGARAKGLVSLSAHGELLGFVTGDALGRRWVNAGVYVCDRDFVREWPDGSYDLEQRLMALVPQGTGYAFNSAESLLDIGTPACLQQAGELLAPMERMATAGLS